MYEIMTNEWLRADGNKWTGREVIVRFSDDTRGLATWNGYYWVTQDGHRVTETVARHITHFYVFEKFYEQNVL